MAQIPLFLKKNSSNQVYLNDMKRYVTPYFLVGQNLGNNTGILALGANLSAPIVMTPDQNGPFEGSYLTCEYFNQNILCRINDSGHQRDLMNRDIHVATMWPGAPGGQSPFVLPETLWMEQRNSLILTFTDFSGAANSIRPVVHGRKFFLRQAKPGLASRFLARRRMQRKISTPYWYTTDANVAMAAGALQQRATISVSDEGHFVAYKITCISTGPFNFKLMTETDGQSISGATYVTNTSGTGIAAWPYILPEPWFIERNTRLILEMNNTNALGANNVWFTLSGRRLYDEQYRAIA